MRHTFKTLRDVDAEQIRGMLAAGAKQIDVARQMNCSPVSVMRIAAKQTFNRKYKEAALARRAELNILFLRDMYATSNSYLDGTHMIETTTTTAAPLTSSAKPTGKWTLNATTTEATGPDGKTYAVTLTPGSPPLIRDPDKKINKGKPTSIYDLMWEHTNGKRLKGNHAVPSDRNYADQNSFNPAQCAILTPTKLHKEYQERQTRGRKTDITVTVAAQIKSTHYAGGTAIKDIASDPIYGNLSVPTVSKILKGENFWYA